MLTKLFTRSSLAASIAAACVQAHALTVSPVSPTLYGSPLFSDPAITAFTVPNVGATTNATSTNIVVNDRGVIEVYLQLPAGAKWNNAALNGQTGTTSLSNMTVAGKSVALNTATLGTGDISTTGRTLRLRYSVAVGTTSLVGFGANFAAPAVANQILTAGSGLGTVGATLGLTVAVYANAGAATTVTDALPVSGTPTTLTQIENTQSAIVAQSAIPASCDSSFATGGVPVAASSSALIDAIQAIVFKAPISPSTNLQNPDSTSGANNSGVDFGRIACTVTANVKEADGTTAYDLNTGHTFTARFTGNWPTANLPATDLRVSFSPAPSCFALGTGLTATTPGSVYTLPPVTFVTGDQYRLCVGYHAFGGALTSGTIAETTPTWVANIVRTAGGASAGTGSGALYSLRSNGAQVDMHYAVSGSAAESLLRIVNTGTTAIAANRLVSQYVYADGTISNTCSMNASAVPAGGSVSILQNSVSNLQSAPFNCVLDTTKPFPRLRITAPTNDMTVQFFVKNRDWVLYGSQQAQRADVSTGGAQGSEINLIRSMSR
jgi:hypothetical protein